MEAAEGTPPYGNWTVTVGTLPVGLSLDVNTGEISGTPTAVEAPSFTVEVTDNLGATDTQDLSITINAPEPFAITTTTLPDGTTNQAYSATLETIGGTAPYIWTFLPSGVLPAGLSLDDSTGEISGTPTEEGTQSFTVDVTDGTFVTVTQDLSITVNAAEPLAITTTSLPDGTTNQAYSATLAAAGGTPPYGSWKILNGLLPAGLSLDFNTGVISGTPLQEGFASFFVEMADSDLATAFQALTITVNPGSIASSLVVSYATEGGRNDDKHLSITFTASDDGGPVSGVTFNHTLNNNTTGDSWGPVTATTGSNGTVTFTVKNAPDGCYSVTLNSADSGWDGPIADLGLCKP